MGPCMSIPLTTHKRADAISLGVMIIGFGVLFYLTAWWPGVLLVIGSSLVMRQYLRGRHYDIAITTLVFGGLFLYFYFDVDWAVVMPVLFVVGGIYLVFREYFVTKQRFGEDQVADDSQEIEDAAHNK